MARKGAETIIKALRPLIPQPISLAAEISQMLLIRSIYMHITTQFARKTARKGRSKTFMLLWAGEGEGCVLLTFSWEGSLEFPYVSAIETAKK